MLKHVLRTVAWLMGVSAWLACSSAVSVEPGSDAGMAGSGGAGGAAGDCAHDGASVCGELGSGWIATKTTLDVWWPGTSLRDPGRSDVDIVTLARVDSVCGESPTAEVRVCDVTLPVMTADMLCRAYEFTIPHAAWEAPTMPRFTTTASLPQQQLGEVALAQWASMLGIDLQDGTELGAWPQAAADIECEQGAGTACFPDHDNDGSPGISVELRDDVAEYVGPYDNGRCSVDVAYSYRTFPLSREPVSAAGVAVYARMARAHLGVRSVAAVAGEASLDCTEASGIAQASAFDVRLDGCMVDPDSISPFGLIPDPRLTNMDYRCTAEEAVIADEFMPAYRVLQVGEMPGDSARGLGWQQIGRDIDRTPSAGSRSSLVYLGSLSGPEPSCAQVRAVLE